MNPATWSVRGLSLSGALRNLKQVLKRYEIMVAARQENICQVSEIFDTGDYGVCYNCNNGRKFFNWIYDP